MLQRCPTCERMFSPDGVKALPFCSARCQQVDLGLWLGEKIGIPLKQRPPLDEEESEAPEGWYDEPQDG